MGDSQGIAVTQEYWQQEGTSDYQIPEQQFQEFRVERWETVLSRRHSPREGPGECLSLPPSPSSLSSPTSILIGRNQVEAAGWERLAESRVEKAGEWSWGGRCYSAQLAQVERGETSASEQHTEIFMYRVSQLLFWWRICLQDRCESFGNKGCLKVSPALGYPLEESKLLVLNLKQFYSSHASRNTCQNLETFVVTAGVGDTLVGTGQ